PFDRTASEFDGSKRSSLYPIDTNPDRTAVTVGDERHLPHRRVHLVKDVSVLSGHRWKHRRTISTGQGLAACGSHLRDEPAITAAGPCLVDETPTGAGAPHQQSSSLKGCRRATPRLRSWHPARQFLAWTRIGARYSPYVDASSCPR